MPVAQTLGAAPPWGLQNRSQIDPNIDENIDAILDSFWAPLGSLLASLLGPLGRRNWSKFAPRGSRFAPRGPKIAPRPAKITIFVRKVKVSKSSEKPDGFVGCFTMICRTATTLPPPAFFSFSCARIMNHRDVDEQNQRAITRASPDRSSRLKPLLSTALQILVPTAGSFHGSVF